MNKQNKITSAQAASKVPQLEWVPGWEGVLKYAPEDLRNDRPLRLWRVRRLRGGKVLCYELSPSLMRFNHSLRHSLRPRVAFKFLFKGLLIQLQRSALVQLCRDGFAVCDRRHWVIDHINNITVDDRPSNLQVISQKENVARSRLLTQINRFSNAERKRQCEEKRAWMQAERKRLMAIYPLADANDIEFELALSLQERYNNV